MKSKQLFGDPSCHRAHRVVTCRRQHLYGRFQCRFLELDRALSKLGLASRLEARRLIRSGQVTVAGLVVTDPAQLVVPESSSVPRRWRHRSRRRSGAPSRSTNPRHRHHATRSARPENGVRCPRAERRLLVAVGRLDLASTGLLLLTTDTQLAARLTDPRNQVIRRYVVTARGRCRMTRLGPWNAAAASPGTCRRGSKRSNRETHLIIELTEGGTAKSAACSRRSGTRSRDC